MKNIKARLKSLMEKQLTDWDSGFIESVSNQIDRGYKLSEKQMNLISKIENKHSPEALRKRDEWVLQYNEEKRKIATICATYYDHHGDWWLSLSRNILDNKIRQILFVSNLQHTRSQNLLKIAQPMKSSRFY